MEAIGLSVTHEARSGKEADAEAFLKSAQPLAQDEKGILRWYAMKLGPGKFGIFAAFSVAPPDRLPCENSAEVGSPWK